jgi:hypothetical protein
MAMKDLQWASLVESVRTGSCVLVIGPDVPAVPREPGPTGAQEQISVREAFCQFLTSQLEEENLRVDEKAMFALAQMYEDFPTLVNLKNVAASFFRNAKYDPSPFHLTLADCPFSLILTTCHDDLFERALFARKKTPSKYRYHYRGEPRDNIELDSRPSPEFPALYHLYGAFDRPDSLVLTENDLLEFITNIISGRPKLPDSLKSLLRNNTFLFVGFGIQHWYVRVLLKLLIRAMGISSGAFALESLRELDSKERQQTVLFYRRGTPRIDVVDIDAFEFAKELLERLNKEGGYLGAGPQRVKRAQVFISYERSDSEIARRLFDALPRDRFEPCLDTDFLEGGQDWNQELEDRIRSSDYFLVLNSQALADKKVGYVNKELAIALDMQRYRQQGTGFIIPLQVEGIAAESGQPDLKRFQQIPLRHGLFDDDVGQIVKTIFRDHQLRTR